MQNRKAPTALIELFQNDPEELVSNLAQFRELMNRYQAATKEVTTKLEILSSDFEIKRNRNPIESITTRLKKPASIAKKLSSRGFDVSIGNIVHELNDVAGIRVICSFIDDIYLVAGALAKQDDITVVSVKDYIENPKPNGYRSYHMIVEVPVFFTDKKEPIRVEVQIRTVAMDFWASLEHEMKYKTDIPDSVRIIDELRQCAETIAATDRRMLEIRSEIEALSSDKADLSDRENN